MGFSFFWHDYETYGRSPRRDAPAQFAGVRTDAELNEIEPPVMHYGRPAPDALPEPGACLLTGITPQLGLQRGLAEHALAAIVLRELARAGTVGVGYNSMRFDDEVTRFLFWRNLIDPYAREWRDGCGRWDLLDVLRCCHALRPDGIAWPHHEDGRASFRLEDLAAANGVAHADAHDALADVRATLALARLVRTRQRKLWDFCFALRSKRAVIDEMGVGRPFLHVSGMYGAERGSLALVWPLAPHPVNRNEIIVWDCAHDPSELFTLGAAAMRQRMFTAAEDLPEGVQRLPIKTIHLNRAPIVIANLRVLSDEAARRWGIDLALGMKHAELCAARGASLAGLWPEVMQRPPLATPPDVDEALYDGLLSDTDRVRLDRLRALDAAALAKARPAFDDARLPELVFRYRARNFPAMLDDGERQRWQAHLNRRLHDGDAGRPTLDAYLAELGALAATTTDERGRGILQALAEHAKALGPVPGDD